MSSTQQPPMKVHFANDRNASEWDFRLGRYLAERLPCLARKATGERINFEWDRNQLGPLSLGDCAKLAELDRGRPGAAELPCCNTVQDALMKLEEWILATLKSKIPETAINALAVWLRNEWLRFLPEPILNRVDWIEQLWVALRLTDQSCLVVDSQNYGLLPELVGRIEVHPAGWQATCGEEGQVLWRHEEISEKGRWCSPAHLCDTLEYCFSERRLLYNSHTGREQVTRDGFCMRPYERMDAPHRVPETAPNDEGTLAPLDNENSDGLVTKNVKPYPLCLLVNFRREGFASNWKMRTNAERNALLAAESDHLSAYKQELLRSLAEQWISKTMHHFVYQTLSARLFPISQAFRIQVRNLIETGDALSTPTWLQPGPLRATLNAAQIEWKEYRKNKETGGINLADLCHPLKNESPQSWEVWDSLEWLEKQPTGDQRAIRELQVIDWNSRMLVIADLAEQVRSFREQRRQTLLEAHGQITGLFEALIRALFAHASFQTRNRANSGISLLFCEWVAGCDRRATARSPYSHRWYHAVRDDLIMVEFNNMKGSSRLADILLGIARRAVALPTLLRLRRRHQQVQPQPTGNSNPFVRELLSASQSEMGTSAWARRLASACQLRMANTLWQPKGHTVANLLLIGLMLIETRNFLIHGQEPLETEAANECVVITNYESGRSLLLDGESLECCFRLFVAASTLVLVISGLNPLRVAGLSKADRQRMDGDTDDRDLFLRSR